MKVRLGALSVAASVIALFSASPVLADPSGYISLGGDVEKVTQAGFSFSLEGNAFEGQASGAFMFTPRLGAQGDVLLNHRVLVTGPHRVESTKLDAALHGFYREADKFLVGGFVQLGNTDLDLSGAIHRGYVGAEGQVFLRNLTLYGQVAHHSGEIELGGPSIEAPGWLGNFELRYFLTPNFRIEGHVGAVTAATDAPPPLSYTVTTTNVGIGTEYKFDNAPISLFATYDFARTTYNQIGELTLDSHRLMLGVRFALGEDTLLDRDRNGASLKPVPNTLTSSIVGY